MTKITYADINRVLSTAVTTERVELGWKGTLAELLQYEQLPLDARVNACLHFLNDNHLFCDAFSNWCENELRSVSTQPSARAALRYQHSLDGSGNMRLLASLMRRAYFEQNFEANLDAGLAVSAMIGAAGQQAIAIYSLLKQIEEFQDEEKNS